MHNKLKPYIAAAILAVTIIWISVFPKPKYTAPDVLSRLSIPYKLNEWTGVDTEIKWNIEDDIYNFLSQAFDREYMSADNKNLFLLMLNGSNFHNPKICFRGAGFTTKELDNIRFQTLNSTFNARSLYAESGNEGFLIIYWMCVDGRVVNWTEQKLKELYYTLIDRNRASLMVRLDIPCKEGEIDNAVVMATKFVDNLSRSIKVDQSKYIFGGNGS
ncbi:MAG: EpsI family protein [Candidatus Kuenenia stuttgartiensis]|nr:EpsI family protein [Candidatus Kuenenia stuttgartiensis]